MRTLFIHPRRGLFQITQCKKCGHLFECAQCDASLVTYKTWANNMELVCHQCQSYYNYPKTCPECYSRELDSKLGGIDELVNQLQVVFPGQEVLRLDKKSTDDPNYQLAVTTRLYDPGLEYPAFDRLVFVSAQNLLASPDYLVHEDTVKALTEVLRRTGPSQQVIFDTKAGADLFDRLLSLNLPDQTLADFFAAFLESENNARRQFLFPPHANLVLLTVQQRKKDTALAQAREMVRALKAQLSEQKEVTLTPPYPARFLRRKNLYSYHILLKYPKNYSRFFELRDIIQTLRDPYSTQVRLNPKHLF